MAASFTYDKGRCARYGCNDCIPGVEAGGKVAVDKYVVAGASKRGWTTWTTAAVDRRVVAIIPMVIDTLNAGAEFRHQFRVYGGYSSQVQDYVDAGIMNWAGTVEYRNLLKIEDPFEYRSRLTMPKFIINGSGDQYFLPDSSQFYFDKLNGEKYLRYVPNANHSVEEHTDAAETVEADFNSIVKNLPRPEFAWRLEDGRIVVDTRTEPTAVKLWQATNPNERDFRLEKIGPAYKSSDLKAVVPGHYVAELAKPDKGYTAYFIELTYPSGGKYPFKFTTGVKVVPDVGALSAPEAGGASWLPSNTPCERHAIQQRKAIDLLWVETSQAAANLFALLHTLGSGKVAGSLSAVEATARFSAWVRDRWGLHRSTDAARHLC